MTKILLFIAFFIVFGVIATENNSFLVEEKNPVGHTDAYNDIIRRYRNDGQTFVDDSFPHSTSSIGGIPELVTENAVVQWLRPGQIATKNDQNNNDPWSVFNSPQPTDIEQGRLGNCWLISALAAVAERPEILEKLVITKEYNPSGVYEMRLCIDGIWQHILVDDYFPSRVQDHTMVFATASKKQLWVSLVEKALAKAYGSYSALIGGKIYEGFATLTGWPILSIDLEEYTNDHELDLLWALLINARKSKYPMSCAYGMRKDNKSEGTPEDQEDRRIGHAYSILELRQLAKGKRFLQIRNPLSYDDRLGKLSRDWPEWTPKLRQELANQASDLPGTFWMPFHRFVGTFKLVDIAEIREHQGWVATRYKVDIGWQEGQTVLIRLVITERTELCATLFQHNSRSKKDNVDLMLLLHKQKGTNEPADLIARSPHRKIPFVRIDNVFLEPGDYLLCAHSFTKFGDQQMVAGTIVIHSSKSIRTELVTVSLDNLRASLVALILKWGEVRISDGITTRCLSHNFSGIMVMSDNNNPDSFCQVLSESQGSSNVLSTRGSLEMVDWIPPLHRQIVTILTHVEPTHDFHAAYNYRNILLSANSPQFQFLSRVAPQPAEYHHFPNYPAINGGPFEALHGPHPI